MKKILLTIGLMLSANAWANPMDSSCKTDYHEGLASKERLHIQFIRENCERNNILYIYDIKTHQISTVIADYCRQDRQINVDYSVSTRGPDLVCVLYASEPRKEISDRDKKNIRW